MEEKFLYKMIQQCFYQYERDLAIDPLTDEEYVRILAAVKDQKDEGSEWYEVVEDVVYGYVTNQEE
ncbi:YqzH family protein [Metabacillus herbersteinensis]|uniref:YqzH family protein n=1 Tax=Metabacillus herbersteinensis TaxID=283816 RepID=A0ABV6GCS0_9BACI